MAVKRKRTAEKRITILAVLAALCVILSVPAYGTVTAAADVSGSIGTVYVAGNPNFYPIEYYDADSQSYQGIMPELLEEISARYGVDFVYIRAGARDIRAQAAENGQAELISGCLAEEDIGTDMTASAVVLSLELDGQTVHVCFGYTDIAPLALREAMDEYLVSIDVAEIADAVISEAVENGRQPVPAWLKAAVVGGCVLLFALIVVLLHFAAGVRRRREDDGLTDRVTGAGNKQYFFHCYQTAAVDSVRPLYYIFYLCFDISQAISLYGTDEAENVLRYAADVLSGHIGDSDFFGRISDDSFAVLRQCGNHQDAEKWAAAVLGIINNYGQKFAKNCVPAFHAGIYKLAADDKSCETALYAARQGYRNALENALPYSFAEDKDVSASREMEELRRQALHAISAHEFKCYLQYIVDLTSDTVYGAEVLSRWLHPTKGLLMPGRYIEDMENNGMILELDFYMLEETCRMLSKLANDGMGMYHLFCNVSRKTFSLTNFCDRLLRITQRYRFSPDKLVLEITESCVFQNGAAAEANVRKCKDLGFKIALDDVGSGYSCFSDLMKYSLDVAKLDRDILLGASREDGKRIMSGLNELFHYIGTKTLCEGAEMQGQCELARELEMDFLQGFYVQKPLPAKVAIQLLKGKQSIGAGNEKFAERI